MWQQQTFCLAGFSPKTINLLFLTGHGQRPLTTPHSLFAIRVRAGWMCATFSLLILIADCAAAGFPPNASQFSNQSGPTQVSPTSGGSMATAQGYNATQAGQLYQGSCPVPLSQFPAPTPRCYNPKTHGQTIKPVVGTSRARKIKGAGAWRGAKAVRLQSGRLLTDERNGKSDRLAADHFS